MSLIKGANGSVGEIIKPAEKVPGYVEVKVISPKGHHHKDDVCLWPLHPEPDYE